MLCRLVLMGVAAASIMPAVGARADADSQQDCRERLEKMTGAEKEELRRKKERFDRLSPDQQDRLRQLHEKLSKDPQSARLRQIMVRYGEWLKTLPSGQRAELLSMLPDQRIAQIKKYTEQQERQRFHELVLKKLKPEDYGIILRWFEEKLLAGLTADQRKDVERQRDPRGRIMDILRLSRQLAGDQNPRFLDRLTVTEHDVQELATRPLSSEARAALEQAPNLEAKQRIVRNWAGAAVFSRITPRVSNQALQRFLEEHVDPKRREYLENLPRDRMLSELRKMYYMSRFRDGDGERFPPPYRKRPPADLPPPGAPGRGAKGMEPPPRGEKALDPPP
jgi:hypothetical protein